MSVTTQPHELAITVKKQDDFGEWYHQLVQKGELIMYSHVSGCYTLLPKSYFVWEEIQRTLDREIKLRGVKNCYYPLFISKKALELEKQHFDGFQAEVAWVTRGGVNDLVEPIAVRPTSETIMYSSFPSLINSYHDLPLKLNQWCNVVRWEFRDPTPFIRSREFLWQEGHTVYETKDEAFKEVLDIIKLYKNIYQNLLAVPCVLGKKTNSEKFAGADETYTIETYIPNCNKGVQAATSHMLGQNFSKMFGIEFIDKDMKKQHPYQNSWGFTTRSIGVSLMTHSDDKGVVLPPSVSDVQIVIIPIFNAKNKDSVMKCIYGIYDVIKNNFRCKVDDRNKRPGWKYNYWELRGVPLRIEIGEKDIEKNQVTIVFRHTGEKTTIEFNLENLTNNLDQALIKIHQDLYEKAEAELMDSIVKISTRDEFMKNNKLSLVPWCGDDKCEMDIKKLLDGVKSLCIPEDPDLQKMFTKSCLVCENTAMINCLFGRSY